MKRINSTSTWIVSLSCLMAMAACQSTGTNDKEEATARGATQPEKSAAKAVDAVMVRDAAKGAKVIADCPPNVKYSADGLKSLVDGKMGSDDYQDHEWMGWWYEDKPFDIVVDLGKPVAIEELGVHTLTAMDVWIFYPRQVEFEVSNDGKTFEKVATVKPTNDQLETEFPAATILKASGLKTAGRYVRVRAKRYGELPEWHMGYGGADGYKGEAWLFIDEILVNPN